MDEQREMSMILSYNITLTGNSHRRNDRVCQDYSKIVNLENGYYLAIVADGVGSAAKAETGSRIAVEAVADFCKWYMSSYSAKENWIEMLQNAYMEAYEQIIHTALENRDPLEDYDTTLSCVLYNGREIVYGHVGDGGIIGLTENGEYIAVTQAQKGADGYTVIPLRAGKEAWVFGIVSGVYAAVLLATDGMYEGLFMPPILKLQSQHLFVGALSEFMDMNEIEKQTMNFEIFQEEMRTKLEVGGSLADVTEDDKTVAVLINAAVLPRRMNEEYYREPDWDALWMKRERLLYPDSEEPKEEIMNRESSDSLELQEKKQNVKGKKVLIVGSDGVLRKHLAAELKEKGYDIKLLDIIESWNISSKYNYEFIFCLWIENQEIKNKIDFLKRLIDVSCVGRNEYRVAFVTYEKKDKLPVPFSRNRQKEETIWYYGRKIHVKYFEYPKIFGKWCVKSEKNMVAQYCRSLTQKGYILLWRNGSEDWVYANDVAEELASLPDKGPLYEYSACESKVKEYSISEKLLEKYMEQFQKVRRNQQIENLYESDLMEKLYSVYLSYLPVNQLYRPMKTGILDKGKLQGGNTQTIPKSGCTELYLSHYECVSAIKGQGNIFVENRSTNEKISYKISEKIKMQVDIPDGCRYKINNTGDEELIILTVYKFFPG